MVSVKRTQAEAFEAAVRELDRMYPVLKCPVPVPSYSLRGPKVREVFQQDVRMNMITYAGMGAINTVRANAVHSGIPKEHLEAVIALIYDGA